MEQDEIYSGEVSASEDLSVLVEALCECAANRNHRVVQPVQRLCRQSVAIACDAAWCRLGAPACSSCGSTADGTCWKPNKPLARLVRELPPPGENLKRLKVLVEDATTCVVCAGPVTDAVHTHPCGHGVFCRGCLEGWLQSRFAKTCPCCRAELDPATAVVPNLVLQTMADQTPRTCPHKSVTGCTEHPTRVTLATHVCPPTSLGADQRNLDAVLALGKAVEAASEADYESQHTTLVRSLAAIVALCGEIHPLAVRCLAALGDVEKKLGRYESAAIRYRKASHSWTELSRACPTQDFAPAAIKLAFAIAEVERKQNRWKEAEVGYHHALTLLKDWPLDPRHENARILVHCHRGNGLLLKKQALYDQAHQHYSTARRILAKGQKPKHGLDGEASAAWKQSLAVIRTDEADLYRKKANYPMALSCVDLALEELTALAPLLSRNPSGLASDLGDARYAKALVQIEAVRDLPDALQQLAAAEECYRRAGYDPVRHPKFGLLEAARGCALFLKAANFEGDTSDFAAAQRHLERAIASLTVSLQTSEDLEIADCHLKWVQCFAAMLQRQCTCPADTDRAAQHLRKAQTIYSMLDPSHPKLRFECSFYQQLCEPGNGWFQ